MVQEVGVAGVGQGGPLGSVGEEVGGVGADGGAADGVVEAAIGGEEVIFFMNFSLVMVDY